MMVQSEKLAVKAMYKRLVVDIYFAIKLLLMLTTNINKSIIFHYLCVSSQFSLYVYSVLYKIVYIIIHATEETGIFADI